jgi:tRNA(Arg) A34 adenosine deaminase TadA
MDHRLGAAVVYDRRIVACGHNHHMPDSFGDAVIHSVHAEMAALAMLAHWPRGRLRHCALVVVRIGQASMDHPLKLARPCAACAAAIDALGIGRVYFSTQREFDARIAHYELHTSPGGHRRGNGGKCN